MKYVRSNGHKSKASKSTLAALVADDLPLLEIETTTDSRVEVDRHLKQQVPQ